MNLGVDGDRVSSVELGYEIRLTTAGGGEVAVESALCLLDSEGSLEFSPGRYVVDAERRLMGICGRVITSARVEVNGALRIEFDDSTNIVVNPDPDFEAWNVSGATGWKVVSLPGGKIESWQDARE